MAKLEREDDIRALLSEARVVAVVGISDKPARPAHYVPKYLAEHGYRIIGVNAIRAGETLFGEPVRETLAEIDEPVDIVDVFRRSEHVPEHLADILAMKPLPKAVWLQLGIRNDAVADELASHGIAVVQDRCTLADHRRFGL